MMPNKLHSIPLPEQCQLQREKQHSVPVWRPIHYLGSKLRLVESIRDQLTRIEPTQGTVCDLFAGSGTVSLALSSNRDVVAADIQEYSRVLCTGILKPASLNDSIVERFLSRIEYERLRCEYCLEPILEFEERAMACALTEPSPLCNLVEYGSLLFAKKGCSDLAAALRETSLRIRKQNKTLMTTAYFGGAYFSYRQSLYIDSVLAALDKSPPCLRETYLSALLSTVSGIVNSVGKQFAQPLKPRRKDGTIKQHLIKQMCRDRRQDTSQIFATWLSKYRALPRTGTHRVVRGDFRDILAQVHDAKVIYADPPYTRDHYSRFYHVLETLCLRDFPDVSKTIPAASSGPSRGIYRTDRHQSPFCIKSQALGAFSDLFAGSRKLGVPLLLSYSPSIKNGHPRMMTIEAIVKLASAYYRRVEVVPIEQFTHSKLNKSELHLNASSDAEILIACQL